MKKLIALLLAVLLVLSLAACAGKPDETQPTGDTQPSGSTDAPTDPTVPSEPDPVIPEVTYPNSAFSPESCAQIIGTWKTPVTLDGSLMNMPEFEGSATFDVIFTFQETGRYTINADENAVLTAIRDYETLLAEYMMEGFYSRFAAEKKLEGMSESEIEEAWAASEQASAQTRVDAFVTGVALTTRFAAIITHGDYYVQNDMLFLSNSNDTYEAYTFTVRNGMLYFLGCSDSDKYVNLWLAFPLPLWPESANYDEMLPEDLTPTGPEYPTVTVPSITEPTDPAPTHPAGFIPIPTLPGSLWPFPTSPVTEPTTEPTDPTATAPAPTDPTEAPTQAPTQRPTQAPTDPTKAPTDPTKAPTRPTQAPTRPTQPPTDPTEAPTRPTQPPTDPTQAPTEAPARPTQPPTDPTETPTEDPTDPDEQPTVPVVTDPTTEPSEPNGTGEAPTDPTYVTDPDDGPIDTNVDWAVIPT